MCGKKGEPFFYKIYVFSMHKVKREREKKLFFYY